MLKDKKSIIGLLIIIIVVIIVTVGIIFILGRKKTSNSPENNTVSMEELESNFKNSFNNIEYSENEEGTVATVYKMEKKIENKYNIDVNIPKINLDTELAREINDEIANTYGTKLLNILKQTQEYTVYKIDYITYINENILSIVIKSTLKEGNTPQRVIMQTYNYDMENNKQLSFEEILTLKNLEKSKIQSKIINTIREKNTNAEAVLSQGYNVYVRDIRSDEYLIKNIKTYFLGQDGHLYIIFAYGNKAFTETMDVIII